MATETQSPPPDDQPPDADWRKVAALPDAGKLYCVVCKQMKPIAEFDADKRFGQDAHNQPTGKGWCRQCWESRGTASRLLSQAFHKDEE